MASSENIDRLRRATREAHEALDRLVRAGGYLSSFSGWTRHLALLARHHLSVERRIAIFPELALLIATRTQELVADLELLGMPAPREPSKDALLEEKPLTSYPAALGCCYVVEGSRLGGPTITAELRRQAIAGLDVSKMVSLNLPGATLRARWNGFLDRVRVLKSEDEVRELVAGAQHTFDELLRMYSEANSQSAPLGGLS